jgi:hypothetical protein
MRLRKNFQSDLEELIDRLTAAKVTLADGKVGFNAPLFAYVTSVLESAVDFNPAIPEADRRGLVQKALTATGREETPSSVCLHAHLKRSEIEYLRRPPEPYVLASAMGIKNYHGRERIRISGVEISFRKALPRKFSRAEIKERISDLLPEMPSHMVHVMAKVKARTPWAAFEESKRSIDLLRGLWCFILQFQNFVLFSTGTPRPVNAILPGPLHTLHRPDGSLIAESFWYEPQGLADLHTYTAGQNWSTVQK